MRNNRYLLILLLIFCQLTLVGCNVAPTKPADIEAATPDQQLNRLYQLAKQSRSPESERYRLQAVNLLLELNRIDEAKNIYAGVSPNNLPERLLAQFALTGAQLANSEFEGQRALDLLSRYSLPIDHADDDEKILSAKLKAQAYDILSMPATGAEQLILIAPHLSGSGAIENRESLWRLLMRAAPERIEEQLRETDQPLTQGWLRLALLVKNNQEDLDQQLTALNRWQQEWPNHPAALDLPDELKLLNRIVTERPRQITLLLPLNGNNGVAGRAIRDGFLSAYYHARSLHSQTPRISIIDTSTSNNIAELYDQAVAQGAEMIIGPLEKENVRALMRQPDLIIPTLAFNYGPSEIKTDNLYQFGLAAEDEAKQVAERAWQDGHRNALALLPDSDWGRRVADAFAQEWHALSGTLLEIQFFSEDKSFSNAIQELLNIDDSRRRAQRIQSLTTTPINFVPRRRDDMDFIFVAASPKQARQIKPTLAFHYAAKTPVYATSHIYSGQVSTILDRDLDEIIFCETPWMLDSSAGNPLKGLIQQTWPTNAHRFGRLYALGIDAYRLFPRIKQLSLIRNARLDGMTGSLQLDSDGRVVRSLSWARFAGGKVRPLN